MPRNTAKWLLPLSGLLMCLSLIAAPLCHLDHHDLDDTESHCTACLLQHSAVSYSTSITTADHIVPRYCFLVKPDTDSEFAAQPPYSSFLNKAPPLA